MLFKLLCCNESYISSIFFQGTLDETSFLHARNCECKNTLSTQTLFPDLCTSQFFQLFMYLLFIFSGQSYS